MNEIGKIATSIYSSEFDSDATSINLTSISGWLSENIGLLNTLLYTSFSGSDPNFGLEEISIYKELYLCNYYSKLTRNTLRGLSSATSSDNILMVSDGDNRIQFANKNEIAKTYKDMAKESKLKLDGMVGKYNIYSAKPLQVGGREAPSLEQAEDIQDVPATVATINGDLFDGLILDGGNDS